MLFCPFGQSFSTCGIKNKLFYKWIKLFYMWYRGIVPMVPTCIFRISLAASLSLIHRRRMQCAIPDDVERQIMVLVSRYHDRCSRQGISSAKFGCRSNRQQNSPGGNQTCKTRSNPSTGSSAKFGCCSRLLHKHLAVATMKGPSIGGRQSCKTRSKPSTESTAIFELMGSFFRPSFR